MDPTKERVIDFIRSLPDESSIEEIRYHLYVYSRAAEGLRAAESGLLVRHHSAANKPASGNEPTRSERGQPRARPGGFAHRKLTEEEILAWADAHRARVGEWPTADSGEIAEAPGLSWCNVSTALREGLRGLPGGSSLARLLALHRGVRNRKALPPYSEDEILGWLDSYHQRHGNWPNIHSGPIEEAPGETWTAVGVALSHGQRGLPGGSSIGRLLAERRGVRNRGDPPPLTEELILQWADAFHAVHRRWPVIQDGEVPGSHGETWLAIDHALRRGSRGMPGDSSLPRLLACARGVRIYGQPPRLTQDQILAWADAYHTEHGRWPKRNSGIITGTDGDKWSAVDAVLHQGGRGLPGGSSLAKLLAERRGAPYREARRPGHALPPRSPG